MNPPAAASHLVSIIVPVRNQWKLTAACLASLYEHTPPGAFEIILIDNASTDETAEQLRSRFPAVRHLRCDPPLNFSQSNNKGAACASGDLLLLLNNDTQVTAGWLPPLVAEFDADPLLAAAGPKLLYPNGLVQQAGVVFNWYGLAHHFGVLWNGSHPEVNRRRYFKALTAACLLCRTSDYLAAGGLDERYQFGGEDTDLCLRWHAAGKKVRYVPESTVIHHESKTPGRTDRVKQNLRLYFSTWRGKIEPDSLQVYAETRRPQEGLRSIAVVCTGLETAAQAHKLLASLVGASECGLEIALCAGDTRRFAAVFSRYSPLITVLPAGDGAALDGWIAARGRSPGFAGVLTVAGVFDFPLLWDKSFEAQAGAPCAVVPVVVDGADVRGVMRYAANLSQQERVNTAAIQYGLRLKAGHGRVFCSAGPADCVFIPASLIRTFASAVGSPPVSAGGIAAAVPSCFLWRNRPLQPAGPAAPAAIVLAPGPCARILEAARLVRKHIGTFRAELIAAVTDFDRDAVESLLALGCVTIQPQEDGPAYRLKNRAAFLALSPVLVFADEAAAVNAGLIAHALQSAARGRPWVLFQGYGAGLMKKTCASSREVPPGAAGFPGSLIAVSREDFNGIGGFDIRYDRYFGELDLCCRITGYFKRAFVHLTDRESVDYTVAGEPFARDRRAFEEKWKTAAA